MRPVVLGVKKDHVAFLNLSFLLYKVGIGISIQVLKTKCDPMAE